MGENTCLYGCEIFFFFLNRVKEWESLIKSQWTNGEGMEQREVTSC